MRSHALCILNFRVASSVPHPTDVKQMEEGILSQLLAMEIERLGCLEQIAFSGDTLGQST